MLWILISIYIFIAIAIVFIFVKENKKISFNISDGFVPFLIDLKNNRIKKTSHKMFDFTPSVLKKNNDFQKNFWVSFDDFVKNTLFDKDSSDNLLKFFYQLKNVDVYKQDVLKTPIFLREKSSLKDNIVHKIVSKFFSQNLTLWLEVHVDENKSFIGYFRWEHNFSFNQRKKYRFIEKEDAVKVKGSFKAFIGFLTKQEFSDKTAFYEEFNNIRFNGKFYLFEDEDITYIMIHSNSHHQLNKNLAKLVRNFEFNLNNWRINFYYDAVGVVENNSIKYVNDLENVIYRMKFVIFKSLESKKLEKFIVKTVDFDEYQSFKNQYTDFIYMLLHNEVKNYLAHVRVYGLKHRKIFANYYLPTMENFSNFWFNKFVQNKNYKITMLEKYSTDFINSYKENKKILLDVSDGQFIKLKESFKNPNIILIVNIFNMELLEKVGFTSFELNQKQFFNGIKIHDLNSKIFDYILNYDPRIVIISRNISKRIHDVNTFMNLCYLVRIIQLKKIKLIYEDIEEKLEENVILKANVNLYYETMQNK